MAGICVSVDGDLGFAFERGIERTELDADLSAVNTAASVFRELRAGHAGANSRDILKKCPDDWARALDDEGLSDPHLIRQAVQPSSGSLQPSGRRTRPSR